MSNRLFLLILTFVAALLTMGLVQVLSAQVRVYPDYAGGFRVESPGYGNFYIRPDQAGGYIIDDRRLFFDPRGYIDRGNQVDPYLLERSMTPGTREWQEWHR